MNFNTKSTVLIGSLLLLAIPILNSIANDGTTSMNSYVEPQVNISLKIENADGIEIEALVSNLLVQQGYKLSSSVSAGEHGKIWAKKGMIKSLWKKEQSYIDLDNLLKRSCFNLRIFTESNENSLVIKDKILLQLTSEYKGYKLHDNLQCK